MFFIAVAHISDVAQRMPVGHGDAEIVLEKPPDAAQQRAWTDDPVTLFRPGAVVKGLGLDARVGAQHTEIKGRLRATFGKGPAEPAAPVTAGARR